MGRFVWRDPRFKDVVNRVRKRDAKAQNTPTRGGTFVYAITQGDPVTLDGHAAISIHVALRIAPHYASLLRQNPADPSQIVGDLARSWTVSRDGKADPDYPGKKVMGSGPFKFVRYSPGHEWVGERFDGSFVKGRPHLDGFRALSMPVPAAINAIGDLLEAPNHAGDQAQFCKAVRLNCYPVQERAGILWA